MNRDFQTGSKVQIIYIYDYSQVNQLTITGFVGESFDFKRYLRLGIPHGCHIDYVSGSVPLNFIQDGRVIVHLIGHRKFNAHAKPHHKPERVSQKPSKHRHEHRKHRSQSHAHEKKRRHRRTHEKTAHIIPVNNSYKNVSHILSTIGLSLEALGRAYDRQRHQ